MINLKEGDLKRVFEKTISVMSLYKQSNLHVPFALRGNLLEIWVAIELLRRFPGHVLDYHGGAYPGVDILLDSIKIQVKTQIKRPPTKCKNGEYDYESSPTIRRKCNRTQDTRCYYSGYLLFL